jgi:hypothetical protein
VDTNQLGSTRELQKVKLKSHLLICSLIISALTFVHVLDPATALPMQTAPFDIRINSNRAYPIPGTSLRVRTGKITIGKCPKNVSCPAKGNASAAITIYDSATRPQKQLFAKLVLTAGNTPNDPRSSTIFQGWQFSLVIDSGKGGVDTLFLRVVTAIDCSKVDRRDPPKECALDMFMVESNPTTTLGQPVSGATLDPCAPGSPHLPLCRSGNCIADPSLQTFKHVTGPTSGVASDFSPSTEIAAPTMNEMPYNDSGVNKWFTDTLTWTPPPPSGRCYRAPAGSASWTVKNIAGDSQQNNDDTALIINGHILAGSRHYHEAIPVGQSRTYTYQLTQADIAAGHISLYVEDDTAVTEFVVTMYQF